MRVPGNSPSPRPSLLPLLACAPGCSAYLPEPEDSTALRTAYNVYLKVSNDNVCGMQGRGRGVPGMVLSPKCCRARHGWQRAVQCMLLRAPRIRPPSLSPA